MEKVTCVECGKRACKDFVFEDGTAYCTACAREKGFACQCGRPAVVDVPSDGPRCRSCLADLYGYVFAEEVELDEFKPKKNYSVVSVYFAYAHHHLVVPPKQPKAVTEKLINKLREALRVDRDLVHGKVRQETWQGMELLEEWATSSPGSPVRKYFGVFDGSTVQEYVQEYV